MKRSTLALLGLSLAIGAGPAVLPSSAAGPECVTYSDPAGDAIVTIPFVGKASAAGSDPKLDIVGLTLNNTSTELVGQIKVAQLGTMSSYSPGMGFSFGYTFNGHKFVHDYYKYGVPAMDSAAAAIGFEYLSEVDGESRPIPVKAAWDTAAKTVTLKVLLTDLEPWAYARAFNATLTAPIADSASDYLATGGTHDTLAAPDESYKIRYGCGPDVVDLGTPPAPAVAVNDDIAPRASCFDASDAKGDAAPTAAGPVAAPNEPSLDVLGFSVNTTATHIKAYLKVDALADAPKNFVGDEYDFGFNYDGKEFMFAAVRAPEDTALPTRAEVNGTEKTALKPTVTYDKATSTVVIAISREALNTTLGTDVPLGAALFGTWVRTWGIQPFLNFPADSAQSTTDRVYVVGHSRCFVPPPSVLTVEGEAPTVQFGDVVTLGASLAGEDGAALGEKVVKFTLNGRSVQATTDEEGYAEADVPVTALAGARTATASFAGDATAAASSVAIPVTVTTETTALTLTVVKSGTGRTVTATLKDDDGKAVVGETVAWTINGKASGSGKTNAAGQVVLKTAKAGQTVVAKYAGTTGKYTGAQATQKV